MAAADAIDITFADRRKPWEAGNAPSSQGPVTDKYATAKEMLQVAGMADWDVTQAPLYARAMVGGKRAYFKADGKVANIRSDTGQILGVVSPSYRVVQNEEAFAFGDAIVDAGGANWERAGMVRGGGTTFGCMEITHLEVNVPGDDGGPIKPYLLVFNGFDGWTPLGAKIAWVRPICINTWEAAYGTSTPHQFKIRHTGTIEGKIAMARDALGITFRHAEEVQGIVNRLASTKLLDEQVRELFATKIWPISEDASEAIRDKAVATKAFEQYMTSDTLSSIRGTAWGALNAVTEYLDHVQEHKPRAKDGDADQLRSLNLLLETGRQRKDLATKALLAVATK